MMTSALLVAPLKVKEDPVKRGSESEH